MLRGQTRTHTGASHAAEFRWKTQPDPFFYSHDSILLVLFFLSIPLTALR